MSNCKLYETLTRCNTALDKEYNPKSYQCNEECPWFGKCFYDFKCPPKNPNLQKCFGGWQKYCVFEIKNKKCKLDNTQYIITNILHLLSPFKVEDIVIFRIIKKSKDNDNVYNIRYICKQGNKSTLLANIKQLNDYIISKCEYTGRDINTTDFKIEEEDK